MRDGEDGGGDRRRSRRKGQCADATIERCQALFQHVVGGIHQSRIDVAEFFQRKKIGGVLGILENVTGSGVDGNGPRRGGGVWFLTGMQCQRAESGLAFRL
jgi:delta 1-pyrroline-5-carboxylate dehydrogenase